MIGSKLERRSRWARSRRLLGLAACLLALLAVPSLAAQTAGVEIREEGFLARLYEAEGPGPHPALLVVGGSEGGIESADRFAKVLVGEGYTVLALAYFAADGLPEQLLEVPLSTFTRGIERLVSNPGVDPERIGMVGSSKGAEAALLIASRDPRIKAVVAAVPSHVVWQAVDRQAWQRRSSWAVDGEEVPFVPYDMSGGAFPLTLMYGTSLDNASNLDEARIPVEQIAGAVLLLSGARDNLWPSARMAEEVMGNLRKSDFPHEFEHISYANAGHTVLRAPGAPIQRERLERALPMMGGTAEGTIEAVTDSWPKMLAFLARNLGRGEQ